MIALQDPPSSTAGRSSWRIDPAASRVEFSIGKRVMLVKKLTVNGRFSNVGGSVEFDPSNPANSRALVKVEAASLDTSDPLAPVPALDATQSHMRDAHLRQADFFDVANHPYLIFESTAVEARHGASYRIHGLLTVKDVTRPIVLDGAYALQDGVLAVTARARLNRHDFGLSWSNLALRIADEFEIRIALRATPEAPQYTGDPIGRPATAAQTS